MKTSEILSLIIPIISIVGGLVAGSISGKRQAKVEQVKWARSLSNEIANELRGEVKDFTTLVATISHNQVWLTWMAENNPATLGKEIDKYEESIHKLLPAIEASHAILASLDYQIYQDLHPLMRKILKQDGELGVAFVTYRNKSEEGIKEIGEFYKECWGTAQSFPTIISEAIKPYSVQHIIQNS